MEIVFLGHSSFRIKSKKTSIIIDPFDSKVVGAKFPRVEADVVTVSHAHKDHSDVSSVKNYRKIIDGPGEYEVGGITIIGLLSYHDQKKGEERGKNTIYVYESEDIRIAHLGDLGHALSDKYIEEMGDIDILMVPVGGEYTIGSKEASEIVRKIQPSIAIPMHYKKAGMSDTYDKLEPVDNFLKDLGMPVEEAEKLSINAIDLADTEKVVVFKNRP